MKTIHQLMLKDTNLEDILHNGSIKTPHEAILFLNALDYVVKEWNLAMNNFDVEGTDDVASQIYSQLIFCRMIFADLSTHNPQTPLLEAIKCLKGLKQSMMTMAKSYARTPSLAHWYLSLPVRVENYYHSMRGDSSW